VSAPGRIATDGGGGLAQNPFAALSGAGLPAARPASAAPATALPAKADPGGSASRRGGAVGSGSRSAASRPAGTRGRVDILRETGGRAGKTVTVAANFTGIGAAEKESLARQMRAAGGCGGTVKDGRIEIQGDQRETVARILAGAGFRPVFAGG
jgi:translation initiation factor 1